MICNIPYQYSSSLNSVKALSTNLFSSLTRSLNLFTSILFSHTRLSLFQYTPLRMSISFYICYSLTHSLTHCKARKTAYYSVTVLIHSFPHLIIVVRVLTHSPTFTNGCVAENLLSHWRYVNNYQNGKALVYSTDLANLFNTKDGGSSAQPDGVETYIQTLVSPCIVLF